MNTEPDWLVVAPPPTKPEAAVRGRSSSGRTEQDSWSQIAGFPTPETLGDDAPRRRRRRRGRRRGGDEFLDEVGPEKVENPWISDGGSSGDPRHPDASVQGYSLRRSSSRARRGWYAPLAKPTPTTTRQAEILNTAVIAPPTDDRGLLIGQDTLSHSAVAHDPFTAYQRGLITSPSCVVVGNVGSGKSSLLMTCYVLRPLILRGRRVVILDKKPRGTEGEYAQVTRLLGAEPIRLLLGEGGTRLNPMDPMILAGTGTTGQLQLLAAMAEEAGGSPLTQWEMGAMRASHRATLIAADAGELSPVAGPTQREPTLYDFIARLGQDLPDYRDLSSSARDRVIESAAGLRFIFEGMLEEFAGLFDGPTSPGVQLGGKVTTFDISQLPEAGAATRITMAVIQQWLLGTLRHDRGWLTNLVVEEGWHLVGGPGGRLLQANVKLARALGLSTVAAIHQPGDIPPDSPAIALLKESQTVHIFRQTSEEDLDACMRLFGLAAGSRETLRDLPQGQHLLKIGPRPEVRVRHLRSPLEVALTDSDAAMSVSL